MFNNFQNYSGSKQIQKIFTSKSTELAALTVNFSIKIKINSPLPPDFLRKSHRIMTIRLLHAGNIPDSWLGNNFSASLPIPKGISYYRKLKISLLIGFNYNDSRV